jgi:hypothetical protein
LAKVKRFSRSEILEEYYAHWQQRRGDNENLEPNVLVEEGAWLRLKGSPMRIDWKSKERKGETFQKLTRYIIDFGEERRGEDRQLHLCRTLDHQPAYTLLSIQQVIHHQRDASSLMILRTLLLPNSSPFRFADSSV